MGIFGYEDGRVSVAEVGGIVGTVNIERDTNFAGAAGEGGVFFDGAIGAHPIRIDCGFDGSNENSFAAALRLADSVEAVIETVDEINVSVAGRAEHGAIAIRLTDESVTSGIVCDVRFGFDDGSAGESVRTAAEEIVAEKARGDDLGGRKIEGARERFGIGH